MSQSLKKKEVIFESEASVEFDELSIEVQDKFYGLIKFLERDGRLFEPNAKKIDRSIFELRVKMNGEWRSLYSYFKQNQIILLRFFNKKTQKLPKNELKLAKKRLKNLYLK
jgi:phage-related protein